MRMAKTRQEYWKGLPVLNLPISHWSSRFLDLCAGSLIGILSLPTEQNNFYIVSWRVSPKRVDRFVVANKLSSISAAYDNFLSEWLKVPKQPFS